FAKKYRDIANGIRKVAKGGPIVDTTHVSGLQAPRITNPPGVVLPTATPTTANPPLQEIQYRGYKVSMIRTAPNAGSSHNTSDHPIQIGLVSLSRKRLFRRLGRKEELTVQIPENSGISVNFFDKV